MEALHHFLDETWHLKALEDVLLAVLSIQDLIECVVLARVALLLEDAELAPLSVDAQEFLRVARLLLVREHGPHTDGDSDV